MPVTAKMNLEYAIRTALFGLMLLGFGGWSLYDGIKGYPDHNRRSVAYQVLAKEYADSGKTRQEWHTAWQKLAESNGWKTDKPKAPHSKWDIRTQFIMALIFCPIGLASLIGVALNSRRRFSAEADGLHGFTAATIPYAAIAAIDKKKWDRKGIAKLEVASAGAGAARKVTLDDWKFRGMTAILAEIEKRRPELVPPPPAPPVVATPAGDSAQPPTATV